MLHAGLDMHKNFSVITVLDEKGEQLTSGRRLQNEESEIREFFSGFQGDMEVVLEAGPSWHWMCDLLDDMKIDNVLCHPLKVKAIASARIKTDKIDSGILAHLSRMDFVPESYKPDTRTRHLRELLRYRASLVRTRSSIKNRVHALLARLNVRHSFSDLFGKAGTSFLKGLELPPVYRRALDGHLAMIAEIERQLKPVEADLLEVYRDSPEAGLLSSIPGVGPVLSLTIMAEIGDAGRFGSAKRLASYAGLVPSTSQSGNHARHGHITKQGSPWLRWALVEAAVNHAKLGGPLRGYYMKMKRKKGNKIARVALARKMATYIYHMLKEEKEFSAVMERQKSDLG
jgi:transposase